jgi:DNA-binding response OmpR family regulator
MSFVTASFVPATPILYQRKATPFERALEVHISKLRRKTEGAGVIIRSIRGVGYVLTGDEQ